MANHPIPEGYHTVTPYLTVDDAGAALDFYRKAFDARESFRLPMKDGQGRERIGHAEIRIGDAVVMLSDEWPDMQVLGPKSRGGATASFLIYTADVDRAWQQALDAGARAEKPLADEPWGDRMGCVVDPFGHRWMLASHIEDVSPEELARRMEAGAAAAG